MLIDIFVPGLFDVPAYEIDQDLASNDLESLEQFFRFSKVKDSEIMNFDQFITEQMQQEFMPPYVQSCTSDGDDSKLILARPMHFKTDMQNAHLIPLESDQRSQDDSRIILEALSALFIDDFSVSEQKNFTWLVTFENIDAPRSYPHPLNVLGRKINPYVEQSRENLSWYRLNNEIQMFMHQHKVNTNRLRDGLPIINGLWFWGAGDGAPVQFSNNICWIIDEPDIKDYLIASGATVGCRIDAESTVKDHAVVHVAFLKALKGYKSEPLVKLLKELNSLLISPALEIVGQHGGTIQLNAGTGQCWQYSKRSHWSFWKKPQSYIQILENNMNTAA